jgi:hypothetical protein
MKSLKPRPWREILRNVAPQVGLDRIAGYEHGFASVMAVYGDIDRRVANRINSCPQITAVYGYEDASLHSFRAARARGVKTYHEVVIGYWRAAQQILGEEAERLPQWASTIILLDAPPARQAQKDEEIGMADEILVASEFTRKTLELCPTVKSADSHRALRRAGKRCRRKPTRLVAAPKSQTQGALRGRFRPAQGNFLPVRCG